MGMGCRYAEKEQETNMGEDFRLFFCSDIIPGIGDTPNLKTRTFFLPLCILLLPF